MITSNIIACFYEAGDCGTWLTWFVNQHAGFYFRGKPLKLRYEQQGYDYGHIPTDYAYRYADWYALPDRHNNVVKESMQTWKEFVKANNIKGSICFKVLPYHNPLTVEDNELEQYYITKQELLELIMTDSNANTILYPTVSSANIDIFTKRLAFIRPEYKTHETYNRYIDNIKNLYTKNITQFKTKYNTVTVEIDKLIIDKDNDTYTKLCNELNLYPIRNWKEIADNYYITILKPLLSLSNEMIDNRLSFKYNMS